MYKKILIEIDFNYVNSIQKLKAVVSEEIDNYAKVFGMKETSKKRASKDYEFVLKVAEEKAVLESGSHSYQQITHDVLAATLLPERKLTSAVKTIGNALKDYEELTKGGGWKKILPI